MGVEGDRGGRRTCHMEIFLF